MNDILNAIGILLVCGMLIAFCHISGGQLGRKGKPIAGCVSAIFLALVGYGIMMSLGAFIAAASVIGAIAGCMEAFSGAKFPDMETLLYVHQGNEPYDVVKTWPFRECKKCLVQQRGDPKVPEIPCPKCGGPFRFPV